MIQDIFPSKMYNQWSLHTEPQPNDIVLSFDGRKALVKAASDEKGGKQYTLPQVSDFKDATLTYLFKIDNDAYFLAASADAVCENKAFEYADITMLRENYLLSKPMLFAILTGKHLEAWYSTSRFCGRCGSAMVHSDKERAMVCQKCHNTVYPRINPAVIVGVKNGDRLLLTRYRTGYSHNALIAGFAEIGETLEETVAREVYEEVGIRVRNITYYKSQPWGVASDILAGFYCEVDGDATISMDGSELKYADWVNRSDIELQPDDASLTNEMMRRFKDGLE